MDGGRHRSRLLSTCQQSKLGSNPSSALTGPLTPGRPLLPHLIYKMIIVLPPPTATQWGINKRINAEHLPPNRAHSMS